MTEWWVSQKKHWCTICKVWTGGHIRQIKKHEEGRAHIENEAQHIKDSAARAKAKEKEDQDVLDQLAEIERKAAAAMVAQAAPPPRVSTTAAVGAAQNTLQFGLDQAAQKRQIEEVIAAAKRPKLENDPIAAAWTKHVDPNSKASYYYNTITKESSWVEPAGFVEQAAVQAQATVASQNPSATGSPWTACTDPNSGVQYYYNSVTKESRWERPPDFEPPQAQQGSVAVAVETAPSVVSTATNAASEPTAISPNPLPMSTSGAITVAENPAPAAENGGSPWVVCTDHSTGYVYYFNKITKASSWEQPADLGVDLSRPPPPPRQKPPPPPARASSSNSTVDSSVPNVGGWQEVRPEDSMWKPKDPNEPDSDDEEKTQDPLIAMKYLTMQRGAWMDEDYERHSKEMEIRTPAVGSGSGGTLSFATRKKASGIRKKEEE